MSWQVESRESAIHVVPLDDLIEHERSTRCLCCPRVTSLGTTCWRHGSSGKIAIRSEVVHYAMDGRQ